MSRLQNSAIYGILILNKIAKNMLNKETNKAIFWDYDMNKIDLNNPKAKKWYLERKLKFGDFSGVSKKDLKNFLPKLDIEPSMKELLRNFLKKYA